MKMKMSAVGEKGIPETDKVYLQIYLPLGGENKTKPMFFSKVSGILKLQSIIDADVLLPKRFI